MTGPFPNIIKQHAQERPDHIAYYFFEQPVTYGEFDRQIDQAANALLNMGMKPGDKIATLLPQSPAFSTLFMAAGRIGMVVVPLDPRFKAGEMQALCERTKPRILATLAFPEEIKAEVEQLASLYEFERIFYYMGVLDKPGALPYEKLLEGDAKPVPEEFHPADEDPYIIIFTSGTTGRPKGAVISHKNSWAISKATTDMWGILHTDKVLCNMPTSHVAGTHDLLAAQFYAGATGILMPKFDPMETLAAIEKYGISYFGGVPTMYRLIFKNADVTAHDLSSVRLAVLSGEPSSQELVQQVSQAFPNGSIVASFGMSETAGFFTFTTPDDPPERAEKTEGKPAPGFEMKIVDLHGADLPVGEVGEMFVRGDSVINGYMDPEDDKNVFMGDGWMATGDLGRLDDQGYLIFMGRIKEMYISGGYNVYPQEIEAFLNAYPGVNTSAVMETPDEVWGEIGVAFVIPEPGVDLDIEALKAHCKKHLADYKRPRKFIVTDDVPRSLIGKVVKKELKKNLDKYLG
ncbi:class I adenylate-forming enzyme family protein [Desulfatibacillum aliphaticivorans]|uniref:class I adenylate-forming enzyme family protein n=1 Tax=Desulfatibacillum aliphaticivorans TaxID=218208 RepID=UPI00041F4476|nr:class I adenylate-forming enzyme family protein [Desulfatibacillum aliphaticivorans]